MKLLVFAHRPEAQEFLKFTDFKALGLPIDGVYKSKNEFLLISGEGNLKASQKLAAVLGILGNEVSSVLNLGVAGSLSSDPSIGLDQIISVRTIYHEEDGQLVYQSFSPSNIKNNLPLLDLITVSKRLNASSSVDHLKPFGQIVDREAHGLAQAAKLFSIPFYCYKIISDIVVENKEDFCEEVKAKANLFSQKLFHFYLNSFQETPKKELKVLPFLDSLLKNPSFHFSRSLENTLHSIYLKLVSKKINENDLLSLVSEFQEKEGNKKHKAKLLIEKFEELVNPFKYQLKNNLEELCIPLKNNGISYHFQPHYESSSITITKELHSKEDCLNLSQVLLEFPFEKIKNLLDGKENV